MSINIPDNVFRSALRQLTALLKESQQKGDLDYETIVSAKDQVFSGFQPMFAADKIPDLSEEEFKEFLLF